jgi:hypothetical protein
MVEKTKQKQRRGFQKGKSGNPSGRPKGARHKTTLAIEALLEGEAEKLTRKAIEKALEGDSVALRLCLDRICPPRKDRPIEFVLPKVNNAAEASKALGAILRGVADGNVTPMEAEAVSTLLDRYAKSLETRDLEARIEALEQRAASHAK